jgi:hypothetical protein
MATSEKKEIYGVFDGCDLIEIGPWDLVERALPYAGQEGEIISLARMSPAVLKFRRAELRVNQEGVRIPWRKQRRFASPRDYALCYSSPYAYGTDLAV